MPDLPEFVRHILDTWNLPYVINEQEDVAAGVLLECDMSLLFNQAQQYCVRYKGRSLNAVILFEQETRENIEILCSFQITNS